jgi:hypothetical protein
MEFRARLPEPCRVDMGFRAALREAVREQARDDHAREIS